MIEFDERNEKHRQITVKGYNYVLKTRAINQGYGTKEFQWQHIRSHNLRKFFGNTLENSDVSDKKLVCHMMGHKAGTVQKAYYRPWQIRLQKFYVEECLPLIQFKETEAIKLVSPVSNKIDEIDRKIKRLERLQAKQTKALEEAYTAEDYITHEDALDKVKAIEQLEKEMME